MEKHIYANSFEAKWIIGGSVFLQQGICRGHLIDNDVYSITVTKVT